MTASKEKIKEEIKRSSHYLFDSIKEDGEIDIHINQVFVGRYKNPDYARMAFVISALAHYLAVFPNEELYKKVQKSYLFLKKVYEEEKVAPQEKIFMEMYLAMFEYYHCYVSTKKTERTTFFLDIFFDAEKQGEICAPGVLSSRALELLYLLSKKEELSPEKLLLQETLESLMGYCISSSQVERMHLFEYADMLSTYRFSPIPFFEKNKERYKKKVDLLLLKGIDNTYTSFLASLFENACYLRDTRSAEAIVKQIEKRKILLSPYLEENFYPKDKGDHFAEIPDTSYCCLDTYAHLLLGHLFVYENKT